MGVLVMTAENSTEIKKEIGLEDMGESNDSHVIKAIDFKLDEIKELKELIVKSEKLQEFYISMFKMDGMDKELQKFGNYRFKTAKWYSPKRDEIKKLEKLEDTLEKFKEEYAGLALNVSKMLNTYNNNNKKALNLFKDENERLIEKIELLNSK